MRFDFSAVGRGERVCASAGAALLVTLFAPWFGTAPEESPFIAPARQVTVNAWHGAFDLFLVVLLLATAVAAIGVAVLPARGTDRLRWAKLRLAASGLGLLATILIVRRMVDPLTNTTLRYGIVLGLLETIAIVAGTQLSMADEHGRVLGREPRRTPPAPTIPPPPGPSKPPGTP